jgi:hypothetical protein
VSGARILILSALCGLAGAAEAPAQVTISAGAGWSGGYPIGDAAAELRTNATGATPPPFTLFAVASRIDPAPGGEARIGVAVTRRLSVEGGAAFARRRLAFDISGDLEAGPQSFAGESLQHYQFEAGLAWRLPLRRAPRLVPFVAGGAGYLRQLHQDRTLVETGQIYYAGGGAHYWLRGRPGSSRSLGLRGDVRLNVRRHGIDFENRTRMYPTLSLHLFVGL